ncbi:MAG: hypothetical protein GXO33_02055 [Epsilonproteobacteria bacterium]|nr:hypothetical protein [Campylobacterota bacterium]
MKRWPVSAGILCLSAVALWGASQGCKGCSAGKLMLQCDYYVARQGDLGRRDFCREYAKVVDIDGASAKAAWYYLLAGDADKAYDAARRATAIGQHYAAGYAAMALALKGERDEARRQMKKALEVLGRSDYFGRELTVLSRLYPAVAWRELADY